jgi:hypothetical protein
VFPKKEGRNFQMRVGQGSLNGIFWTWGAKVFRLFADFLRTLSALSSLGKLEKVSTLGRSEKGGELAEDCVSRSPQQFILVLLLASPRLFHE